jgi:hypothetical protein
MSDQSIRPKMGQGSSEPPRNPNQGRSGQHSAVRPLIPIVPGKSAYEGAVPASRLRLTARGAAPMTSLELR